jgi:hypothetical protein
MKSIMRFNVIHNGVHCPKGSEAPARFAQYFVQKGFAEILEEPKIEEPILEEKKEEQPEQASENPQNPQVIPRKKRGK